VKMKAAMNRGGANLVVSPKAAFPANTVAAGEGIHEGMLGKPSNFQVITRDMFGDAHSCDPSSLVVKVWHLSPLYLEGRRPCKFSKDNCNTCGETSVCLTSADDAVCSFTYTPSHAGFYKIEILMPSPKGDGLMNIQGSPFNAHIEDGYFFLPGVSFSTYLMLFFLAVLGAVAVLAIVLNAAWLRWKRHQPSTEYENEMLRLQAIESELEETRIVRQQRQALLKNINDGAGDDSDSDEEGVGVGPFTDLRNIHETDDVLRGIGIDRAALADLLLPGIDGARPRPPRTTQKEKVHDGFSSDDE